MKSISLKDPQFGNDLILTLGEGRYLEGGSDMISWDGDLVEFLEENGITMTERGYFKKPEWLGGAIENFEPGEFIGIMELKQGDHVCYRKLYCSNEFAPWNVICIDFSANVDENVVDVFDAMVPEFALNAL